MSFVKETIALVAQFKIKISYILEWFSFLDFTNRFPIREQEWKRQKMYHSFSNMTKYSQPRKETKMSL